MLESGLDHLRDHWVNVASQFTHRCRNVGILCTMELAVRCVEYVVLEVGDLEEDHPRRVWIRSGEAGTNVNTTLNTIMFPALTRSREYLSLGPPLHRLPWAREV